MRKLVFDAEKIGPWVCNKTGGVFDGLGTGIGIEQDGKLIGAVLYDNYNGQSICIHVASDGTSNWMTRDFLRMAFDYPFNQLGVKVILGMVDSANLAARRFDEALGFKLEHTILNAGSQEHLLIYSMRPAQCRFLSMKERHRGWEKQSACQP